MESGVLRGVRVDPLKRFCRTFWGVSYLLRGSNPLTPPVKYSLVIKYCHIPTMFCTTCSLLCHPFHRHIRSDLEHMTGFFLNTRLNGLIIVRLLYDEVCSWLICRLPLNYILLPYCTYLHCFIFNCVLSLCHNWLVIIIIIIDFRATCTDATVA